jgi:hypothetical protein
MSANRWSGNGRSITVSNAEVTVAQAAGGVRVAATEAPVLRWSEVASLNAFVYPSGS